ncbi:MAG: PAS domain S-box protein [bacterium]|nr:PAS domain S-box protein [bacterium]
MARPGYNELQKKVTRLEAELADCINQKYALSLDKTLYETLFLQANDAIFIENDQEEIIEVNERAIELTGFSREQLLNMRTIDLQPSERLTFPMFTEGRHETLMLNKEGERIPIEITVTPLKLGKRQFFMSIVRDISKFRSAQERLIKYRDELEDLVEERAQEIIETNKKLQLEILERIETEKALREQSDFNYAVFNNNPIQTIIVNREGKITNYNLAKRESGDRVPDIGEVMYKDFAGNHESDMYAEMMDCIQTSRVKNFPMLIYRGKYLSVTIAPFSKGAIITSIDVSEIKRSEKITSALNEISKAAVSVTKLDELYPLIHNSLSSIIDTTNFYIALYDKNTEMINFPYMVDEMEVDVGPLSSSDSKSGTAYVINTGRSFFGTEEAYKDKLKKGELRKYGSSSKIWVGVPLKTKGEVIGAMVVQSYTDPDTFSEKDVPILEIVADRISTVIDSKRAEEELRRSEEKYRVLVESADDAIFIIDKNGILLSVNKKTSKIIGKSADEIIGNKIFDFLPADLDKEQVKRFGKVFRSGKKTRIDEIYIPFQAGKKWFSVTLTPIRDETGSVVYLTSIARDITKLKKVQKSLEKYQSELEYMVEQRTKDVEQKERELKALLDNITDEAWLKDSRSRYILVNKAFSELRNIPQEEIKGKNDQDLFPIKNAKEYRLEDNKVLETGDTLRSEYSYFDSNNEFRAQETIKNPIFGEKNRIIGTVGISRDITERKLAEVALRESEERFRAMFENMSDGVVIYRAVDDGKNFEILDENKAFRKMTRTQRRKIKGKYITEILPAVKNMGEFDQIFDVWHRGKANNIEASLYKGDNFNLWTEKYIYRLPSGEIVVFYNDITERILAEAALKDSQRQLHQSQRLAASGRLAASIAHEINNPLQAISFSIGFLEEALPKDFSENDSLTQIKNGTKRIKGTVKQLLDIHRKQIKTHEMVDINEIIESTLSLLENQLFINKIEIHKDLDNEIPLINAHSQDLFQVFTNLILNAQDAMEVEGKLLITTKMLKNKLRITVKDNGIGISEKDLEHIFEPFYTTKSNMLGTGLGLSTTKGIVESFGGSILVRSEVDRGSVFNITFPLDQNKRI